MNSYRVGDVIGGEYFVHQIFGGENKSGMGIVYLVTSSEMETPFILKTFQYASNSSTSRDGFLREAKIWANLGVHPNIVRAFWVREISDIPYVAAEYISGEPDGKNTVEHFFQDGAIPEVIVIKWGCQFCFGMIHALLRGMISHRDIKPANLMIDEKHSLRITDFGLAKSGEQNLIDSDGSSFARNQYRTVAGTAMGTYPYMAPEQFTDAKSVDFRADMYGFGVTLFQMLTGGHLPFLPDNNSKNILIDFYRLHTTQRVPKIESRLFPIIEKCLEKNRNKRFQSFEELYDAISKIAKKISVACPQVPVIDDDYEKDFIRAQSYAALGQPEEALNAIKLHLSKHPQDVAAWIEKGRILHENYSSYQDAVNCYQKALEIDTSDSTAWNNLGLTYSKMGLIDNAIETYKSGMDCDPYNTGCMMNLSNALIRAGKSENAHAVMSIAVRVNPKKAALWFTLGTANKLLKRIDDAVLCFEKALQLDNRLVVGWRSLADLLEESGKLSAALQFLEKGISCNPDNFSIRLDKARLLLKMGKTDQATKAFSETELLLIDLTQKQPGNPNHWHNLGLIYLDNHMQHMRDSSANGFDNITDKAIMCFQKVQEIDPHDAFALWTLAKLYYDKHNAKKTISYCNKLLLNNPDYVLKALPMKAQVLSFVGMYKESVEVLREFLDANPNCDSLWFALANIHEYNKNYSSALKCLNICTDILRKSRNPDRQNLVDCERKTREIQQKIKDEN